MSITSDDVVNVLDLLAATPRHLDSLSHIYDIAEFHFKPDEEIWSANEILAHLRACADVWGKSILAMISQDHPTLRYISPRTWMKKTNYTTQNFHDSLKAFSWQRHELLTALGGLKPADWSRGATFTATTRGREQNILSYAQRIANHESDHSNEMDVRLSSLRS